ncbi:zinc finger, CCHC-type containing protein [Tanacetum coccineum]
MGDKNPICTLGDYSKPSHEGYMNTVELPVGNNVVPLRSDTIRTAKLCNDILMFQQHHGESLSEEWTLSFPLKCEIDRTASGKLRNKNANESWEIIENLSLYHHEGWNDTKEFVKPVKAISTPQSTSKIHDRRLLELEDQINFLLKGSRPTPRPSSTYIPQAYAEEVYSNPRPQNQNEPSKQNPFTFCERTGPKPQPQALGTTSEARVWDYMAAHTERMERFEKAIFKQREEINDRMTKMFGFLKELTTSRTAKKILIREEVKFPVTKNVSSISLARGEEERSDKIDVATVNDIEKPTKTETGMQANEAEKKNEAGKEEMTEVQRLFIESMSRKNKREDIQLSPRGPVYEAILRKKITRKEDIGKNFEIPCNIGGLKYMNALVDQRSDVNVMPLSTYMKLTNERPAETDIRLSLASHSYIYPLGIAEDILVEVAKHVYHVDFVILDIKEDEKRSFILGTPFLTTAKSVIKFDKDTITLRCGKSKISFHRILESLCKIKRGVKNDIDLIAPTMTVNRLVMEWEEMIKLHLEREMKFDQ